AARGNKKQYPQRCGDQFFHAFLPHISFFQEKSACPHALYILDKFRRIIPYGAPLVHEFTPTLRLYFSIIFLFQENMPPQKTAP
ncbi:MAG: hypothetical protein PHC80_09365, partial [Eubacteriales bacterium]|nr:hypothetical protein [Eubacteriales bacterium]